MAAILPQDSVTFARTSSENIGYAKQFWKAIDGKFDEKSRLFVAGVDHRLRTASQSNRTTSYTQNTGKISGNIQNIDHQPGLVSNRNEADRRLKIEEEEYVNRVLDQKKHQQDLMKKRRDERLAKETIREGSRGTFAVEELSTFDVDDDKKDIKDEAIQAMKDIDDFERMVKISSEQRKEKQQ